MRRALLVLILVVPFLPLAGAQAQAPRLETGDFWEYHGTATAGNATANVTIRAQVLGVEDVTVNNSTTQGALKVRTATRSLTSTGVDNTADVTSWHRASDLALLRAVSHNTNVDATRTLRAQITTEYEAPCAERVWPLAEGATWDIVCKGRAEGRIDFRNVSQSADRDERAQVGAPASLTLPAGAFEDAYPIRVTTRATNSTTSYVHAPSACRDILLETSHQGVSSRTELTAWRCASTGTSGGTPRLSFPALPEPDRVALPRDTPAPGLLATLAGIALVALVGSRRRSG